MKHFYDEGALVPFPCHSFTTLGHHTLVSQNIFTTTGAYQFYNRGKLKQNSFTTQESKNGLKFYDRGKAQAIA